MLTIPHQNFTIWSKICEITYHSEHCHQRALFQRAAHFPCAWLLEPVYGYWSAWSGRQWTPSSTGGARYQQSHAQRHMDALRGPHWGQPAGKYQAYKKCKLHAVCRYTAHWYTMCKRCKLSEPKCKPIDMQDEMSLKNCDILQRTQDEWIWRANLHRHCRTTKTSPEYN